MTATPLLDRINKQRPQPEPTPIVERMSPFMRRLRERNLPVKDLGAFVPTGSDSAA